MRFVRAITFSFSQLLRYEKFNWITMRNGGSGNKFDGFFYQQRVCRMSSSWNPLGIRLIRTPFSSLSLAHILHTPNLILNAWPAFKRWVYFTTLSNRRRTHIFSFKRRRILIFNPASNALRNCTFRRFLILSLRFDDDNIIINNAHNYNPRYFIRSSRLIALCFSTTSLVRSYITGI